MRAGDKKRILAVAAASALGIMGAGLAFAAGDGGHHVTPPNMDLVYRLMNFGVMAVVLVILLRKPLKSALGGRIEQIKSELAELEAKKAAAQAELNEVEKRLKDAQGEREAIVAEFKAQGEFEAAKIVESAQALAARIKAQAQFTIEQETAMAKADLRREVAELSAALAEDLLKQKITADDQTRLVEEYLAKVQREVQ
ncbi:MAG: ATP synthase F0 subunit B [Desulfarculus sp.]|nr:ATP synthase F0 subunit B [Desulfarculus sp.]